MDVPCARADVWTAVDGCVIDMVVMEMGKMTEIQIIGSSGLCRHSGVPDLPEPRGKHFLFCNFFNLIELIIITIMAIY